MSRKRTHCRVVGLLNMAFPKDKCSAHYYFGQYQRPSKLFEQCSEKRIHAQERRTLISARNGKRRDTQKEREREMSDLLEGKICTKEDIQYLGDGN